ncbi:MAG: ester cyclase [Candidatus Rokuibacteriota bacterium]
MPTHDNAEIARQALEAWNAHDPDRYLSRLGEKFVSESDTLPGPVTSREAAREAMHMYTRAFPDLRFEIQQLLPSGDYVTIRWKATGTHRGELMGIPPTNRKAETHGCTVSEVRDGRIVHEWVYWDTGNLLRQLGVAR